MPLAEMMILRDLMDNRKEPLSMLAGTIQKSLDETKRSCNEWINRDCWQRVYADGKSV